MPLSFPTETRPKLVTPSMGRWKGESKTPIALIREKQGLGVTEQIERGDNCGAIQSYNINSDPRVRHGYVMQKLLALSAARKPSSLQTCFLVIAARNRNDRLTSRHKHGDWHTGLAPRQLANRDFAYTHFFL